MEFLDNIDENKKLAFKTEVKNIEFFELIGGMDLRACTNAKMREKSLSKINGKLFKKHPRKKKKICSIKISREIRVLSQREIDDLLISVDEPKKLTIIEKIISYLKSFRKYIYR